MGQPTTVYLDSFKEFPSQGHLRNTQIITSWYCHIGCSQGQSLKVIVTIRHGIYIMLQYVDLHVSSHYSYSAISHNSPK